MPKRKHSEKIERYKRKLRRLQEKEQRNHNIRIIQSDTSDSENIPDIDRAPSFEVANKILEEPPTTEPEQPLEDAVPELNPEILAALGEVSQDTPKLGPKIHDSLANLWLPILRKGMDKESKDKLLKNNLAPQNCSLLLAPKLNPEILAAVSDTVRLRDKRVESVQQQLGAGIAALNKGLELLLDGDKDRLTAIKHLSDSSRLLCDLHYIETEARKKFVTPGLDKSFLATIQDVERDDMLFGNKLSEKIKASKAIEKQGLQIKRSSTNFKAPAASTSQASTSNFRPAQGNWRSSSRYPLPNRGGRGGPPRKAVSTARRTAPISQAKTLPVPQPRQRAPNPH